MVQKKIPEKVRKVIARKASDVHRFMTSPIGRKVVRMLEAEFPGGFGKDPYDTYRREGNREVVEYLKKLQRLHEAGDLDDV